MKLIHQWLNRIRWEQACKDAIERRDRQTYVRLLNERPELPWLLDKFAYLASGRWLT